MNPECVKKNQESWNRYDEYVKWVKKRYEDSYNKCDQEYLKQKISDEILLKNRISYMVDKLGYTESQIKNIFNPKAKLFLIPEKEFLDKYLYFLDLMGSKEKFHRFMLADSMLIRDSTNYAGWFAYGTKSLLKDKILNLVELFEITYEEAKELIIKEIHYAFRSIERTNDTFKEMAAVLSISEADFAKICLNYPSFLNKGTETLKKNIKSFASSFNVSVETICNMIVKFPPFAFYYPSDFVKLGKYVKQETIDAIIKMPWIFKIMISGSGKKRFRYGSFECAISICEIIEARFGTVENVFEEIQTEGGTCFVLLINCPLVTKGKLLLTYGLPLPLPTKEERLLRLMFSVPMQTDLVDTNFSEMLICSKNHDEDLKLIRSLIGKTIPKESSFLCRVEQGVVRATNATYLAIETEKTPIINVDNITIEYFDIGVNNEDWEKI